MTTALLAFIVGSGIFATCLALLARVLNRKE